MGFNFLKNNKKDFDSGHKNNKPHGSRSVKTDTHRNGYKKYSHRNDMPQRGYYRKSADSSKSNACLLILIVYIFLGYVLYNLLK